jgi:response regulator RpfG family c-di-GMP phosphodiesterase
MALECLAITRDQQSVELLRRALEQFSTTLEVCPGVNSGREVLSSKKYDGVIVDCDDLQGGVQLLEELRRTPSNKSSVCFAMLNGSTTKKAFEMGANFVLQKPLLPLSTLRCFSAAFGQMTREKRRYFRVPVEMPVKMVFGEKDEVRAMATNISEGGMALTFRGRLPDNAISVVQFTLPTTSNTLQTKAELAWADSSGHAGLRFLSLTQLSKEHLERWLSTRMEAAGVI